MHGFLIAHRRRNLYQHVRPPHNLRWLSLDHSRYGLHSPLRRTLVISSTAQRL